MKYYLITAIVALTAWTLLAVVLIPEPAGEGRIPLTWVTGQNPQRSVQTEWFNRLNPCCELRTDPANTGAMKVVVQCSAGMGPDLIGGVTAKNYDTYLDAGILMDLTEIAPEAGFGPDTIPEELHPLILRRDPETLEYRQYVYPANYAHTIILYNKDLFDAHGVSYPSEDLTWEEYIDIARKLTVYRDGQADVPVQFGAGGAKQMICIWGKGGRVMNEGGTRCRLGEPEAIAGMQFFHDLYFRYQAEPTPTQKASVTTQGGFGSGSFFSWFGEQKIAMIFGARWMLIQLRRYYQDQLEARREWEGAHPGETYPGLTPPRLGACLVPRFADGKRYTTVGYRCVGVNRQGPHRQEAVKFLEYLAGPKYSELINRGADSKPPNKKYISLERFRHPDWPGEEPVHRMAVESIPYGRVPQPSMFIAPGNVNRALKNLTEKLQSSSNMTGADIAHVMKAAAKRLNKQIAENIRRRPELRSAYERLVERGYEPVASEADLL